MKIVFASHNSGKIHELETLLEDKGVHIIPQSSLNIESIPETQLTFVENALLKARHASKKSKLPAIADDSGLKVSILNDAPGIYSARFAGNDANSKANIEKLLRLLKDVPEEKRMASFYCVLVYLKTPDDPTPIICEGEWFGYILTQPRGNKGFGYDPIFFDPNIQMSAAECDMHLKNKISHRGRALRSLVEKLQCTLLL